MAGPDREFHRSLGTYADALDAARNALGSDPTSGASIRRIATALARTAGTHGFPVISRAAKSVVKAPPSELASEAEHLLMALLKEVTDPATRGQTVLVVDDDVVLTRLLSKVLDHDGRFVLVAASRREMLAMLKTRWVDLILLDVGLPDLDGREILAALRKNPLTEAIPVVVLTAATEPWVEAECRALGATAFLRKPIDPVTLTTTVGRELTRGQRQQSAAPGPAATPTPTSPKSAPSPDQPRTGEVLLAEHDPLVAQIIKHRLGREGFTIRHFSSGTAALQAAKRLGLAPALVIVDAMTPGIDGIELLRQLRQIEQYRSVPILVLSDIGSEREVVRALEAGADDCIRKPFSPTELVARIDRLLRRP